MGCTPEAIDLFIEKKVMYAPGKLYNATKIINSIEENNVNLKK